MPIRFRCAYCNQLMAIAHRKAGTVVRCPTCSGQVVVPNVESSDQHAAAPPGPMGGAAFEGSDFDKVFKDTARPAPPTQPPAFGPSGGGFEVDPAPFVTPGWGSSRRPSGIVLTPAKGLLLALIVAILLGLAFLGGFLAAGG
jgi:phage FluMu protein Com